MVGAAVRDPAREAIPKGYRQTEIGVLPEDWESVRLGRVAQLINGRGFKPHEWSTRGKPIIRIQNLNGSTDFNYYAGQYDPKIEVENGQLLFAWSGSRGTSFGPHVWNGPKAVLNYHTWKVSHRPELIFRDFLLHALRGLTEVIEAQAHGASALVHVQKWEMEGFQIPLPLLPEQEAIAGALSEADGALRAVERLIAKQRALKQAALHALLTPTTRLPGFTGDWETKTLGEFITFQVGFPFASDRFHEILGIRLVRNRDLKSNQQVIRYNGPWADEYIVQNGDLLVGMDGEFVPCLWRGGEALLNQRIGRIRSKGAIDLDFLFYAIETPLAEIERSTASTTVKHLSHSDVEGIEIRLPPLPEQRAIAAVLSDMDAAIAASEARRDKLKAVKQGMMQALLTGKVRLV
jgi:type I restriction enzyme, S subunit